MEFLRALVSDDLNSHVGRCNEFARETGKSHRPEWYYLRPVDQHGGKSLGPSTYHYYHPHFIVSVGCFVLKQGD